MDEQQRQIRLAYAKGYVAGSRGRWPSHRPAVPPDPVAASIISAAQALRDEVDGFIATVDESDPVAIKLAGRIDAFDAAMIELSKWLVRGEGVEVRR